MIERLDLSTWITNPEGVLVKITDGSPVATFVINDCHKVIHWNTATILTESKKKK
jgi:hypothetical protein